MVGGSHDQIVTHPFAFNGDSIGWRIRNHPFGELTLPKPLTAPAPATVMVAVATAMATVATAMATVMATVTATATVMATATVTATATVMAVWRLAVAVAERPKVTTALETAGAMAFPASLERPIPTLNSKQIGEGGRVTAPPSSQILLALAPRNRGRPRNSAATSGCGVVSAMLARHCSSGHPAAPQRLARAGWTSSERRD